MRQIVAFLTLDWQIFRCKDDEVEGECGPEEVFGICDNVTGL